MKRACVLHDQVNLVLLPILGALTAAGLLFPQRVDPANVTILFTLYIVADFAWLVAQPEAVPSLPKVILAHHVVTFVLLCFPLAYPALAVFTCWDGLCEINTFFLIARRQWRSWRRLFSALYWATFFPLRIALYPVMLVQFYRTMRGVYPAWTVATVCAAQLILIAFNMSLLVLSVRNWGTRNLWNTGKKSAAAAAPAAAAAAEPAPRAGAAAAPRTRLASKLETSSSTLSVKAKPL